MNIAYEIQRTLLGYRSTIHCERRTTLAGKLLTRSIRSKFVCTPLTSKIRQNFRQEFRQLGTKGSSRAASIPAKMSRRRNPAGISRSGLANSRLDLGCVDASKQASKYADVCKEVLVGIRIYFDSIFLKKRLESS